MNDFSSDKNYIENLLKALSVPEAIASFTEIDERILELLKCSTEDFLSLNDHFKSYHKESKNIAQNASDIIQIITDSTLSGSFKDLKNFGESFDQLTSLFSNHIETLDVELRKANNKIESLKIVNSNFKQNIVSIKVLMTNFKKDNNNDIDFNIEEVKSLISSTDVLNDQFVQIALETYKLLGEVKLENYSQLQKLNDNISTGFTLFQKKYTEASNLFPSLKELTDKNASNIAKIITNLQYHDIIRQKIEHIQKTHKDIINDLKSYSDDDMSMAMIHNKAKTFLKIRDVAGLQAAQLLHANKQYQVAIEEIGQNLEEIGNEMISISSMCESLVGKSEQTKDYYLNNIIDNLKNALDYSCKLSDVISEINEKTKALNLKNKEAEVIYNKVHAKKEDLKKLLDAFLKNITKGSISASEQETIKQLNQLLKETDILENHILEILKEIGQKVIMDEGQNNYFVHETEKLTYFKKISDTIPELIKMLRDHIQRIDEYLYFNSSICTNISDNIRNSLRNIKYYDLFEKSCERIVEELNSINLKLNYGTGQSNFNRDENLKHLKDRYTMASEHIIHEQITKLNNVTKFSQNDTDHLIDLANQNSETDDDNLELF